MVMLDVLGAKQMADPTNYGRVCPMLDAMAIKKHITYDQSSRKMFGFEDLGKGSDDERIASEALVFMVVGIQGHWKAPIGYFITNTLRADTQKVLIEHALDLLEARNIKVVCLTMDGHATNVAMCTMLGCQLRVGDNKLITYFPHPTSGDRVFVMMDACHMLKLVRNMFESYQVIKGPDNTRIQWSYIKDLSSIQEDAGLRAGNKLTSKHVKFQAQKMKVALAAQTLSGSVAKTLQMLHDSGDFRFRDALPTVKFIKVLTTKSFPIFGGILLFISS